MALAASRPARSAYAGGCGQQLPIQSQGNCWPALARGRASRRRAAPVPAPGVALPAQGQGVIAVVQAQIPGIQNSPRSASGAISSGWLRWGRASAAAKLLHPGGASFGADSHCPARHGHQLIRLRAAGFDGSFDGAGKHLVIPFMAAPCLG